MQLASRPPWRRLLDIDRLLRAGRYLNARGLAAELEVSRCTVYRDLDFLRASWGAPLEFCPRHNGYYYTEPGYALPLLGLSEGEVVALFQAERVMHQYRGTPYQHDLATAFRKVTAQLPDTVRPSFPLLTAGQRCPAHPRTRTRPRGPGPILFASDEATPILPLGSRWLGW